MKTYTDISQSRKLVEILSLESADMCYLPTHIGNEHHFITSLSPYSVCTKMTDVSIEYCTPCWSLSALLYILPNGIGLFKTVDGEFYCLSNDYMTKNYDNPIDACVEIIINYK